MRAIGRMLIERHGVHVWRDVYRVFVEQQGLAYEPDAEWLFLAEIN